MRLTLRRSMLSSRAMARWLWPTLCQARTVCATLGDSVSTGGASSSTIGMGWPILCRSKIGFWAVNCAISDVRRLARTR
jgi:hypothetical protein